MLKLVARWETKIFLGVFLVGLAFAAYTQHAWEDFFIVLRQAQNLAQGHGLVYQVGERLHTFTSPLGVLLPAAISWVIGAHSYESVLWIFRVISLAALAAGIVLLYQILRQLQRHDFATAFTLAMISLDAKTIDFSTNGMETGLLLFFLALTLHGMFLAGPRQPWRIGLGFAGLMWCRPDGCVYIAALGIGALLFLPATATAETRGHWFKRLLLAAAICAMLYLPWFLWTWSYYGSPVPQPILAKGSSGSPFDLTHLLINAVGFPFLTLMDPIPRQLFMPAYAGPDWPPTLAGISTGIAWVTALAWLCPWVRPPARVLSVGVYLGQLYLCHVVKTVFPWYLPVVAVMGYLTLGLLLDQILDFTRRLPELDLERGWLRHSSGATRAICILLVLGQLAVFASVARQMQVEQSLIEDGLRRPIGLWLRDHAHSPNDTVMLEPLGYVGYFSQLRMLDHPGLSSKRMVEVRRQLGPQKEKEAYLELKPDWIVLRPDELQGKAFLDPAHLKDFYELAKIFDQSEKVRAAPWLPGRGMVAFDQTFYIFHRKDAPPVTGKN